ncbi:MAG: nucleoside deaminase, partial [Candidatus Diapherotrites archaeon CG08_land_8_20_14_0_20_30_16]
MNKYMKEALKEDLKGIHNKEGGPFGCVIVCKGKVIAKGHNLVTSSKDPTSHAEIVAIRKASKRLGRFDLKDCELYTTCEPCPMCFSAIHWSRIKKVYYAC